MRAWPVKQLERIDFLFSGLNNLIFSSDGLLLSTEKWMTPYSIGSITGRCSGNEPALLPGGVDLTREIGESRAYLFNRNRRSTNFVDNLVLRALSCRLFRYREKTLRLNLMMTEKWTGILIDSWDEKMINADSHKGRDTRCDKSLRRVASTGCSNKSPRVTCVNHCLCDRILSLRSVARIQTGMNSCDISQRQNNPPQAALSQRVYASATSHCDKIKINQWGSVNYFSMIHQKTI